VAQVVPAEVGDARAIESRLRGLGVDVSHRSLSMGEHETRMLPTSLRTTSIASALSGTPMALRTFAWSQLKMDLALASSQSIAKAP